MMIPSQRVMRLDQSNNLATLYTTPAWPTPAFCSAFSALGSATILRRLDTEDGYAPELVSFNDQLATRDHTCASNVCGC